jgi:hypothetical protein
MKTMLFFSLVAVLTAAALPLSAASSDFPSAAAIAKLSAAERLKLAEKTEVWQPVPTVVTSAAGQVPSDAIQLLDNTLSQWQAVNGKAASWQIVDGVMTVTPGSGDIKTKADFCDIQLHLEWRAPLPAAGKTGQLRNNSGIFLQEKYEIQILDSYQNATYPNGQAAAVYKQTPPLVNAMRPAGEWQSYDIIYQAPRFDGDKLTQPGHVTLLHNGVLVQNHSKILGTTEWIGPPQQQPHGCAPLKLQDHGDQVSFRNIWVRRLN